ncbi:MAG: 3-oxoacyl-[acyl-carrier-protein] reductase FabG [Alphaproteobacteria bacterium MarineAlpha2_Bin1]|nr:MAG: 3-oxoacyl-[acyl-carrier-protein] reductase FabG [Alphaproteobacteria bacterium MarineAlpha2_Bin1]
MKKKNKRIAIVTGSAKGIGRTIAEKFLEENIYVILADINDDELKKTSSEIDPYKENTESVKLDVSSENDLEKLKIFVEEKFGYLDILVNNAGIAPNRLIEDQLLHEWEKVIKVNLTGTFLCSKMAIELMKKQSDKIKYILNITSISGSVGSVGRSAYGVSKAGIIQLTKQMAVELAEYNILVNSISPGPVNTDLTNNSQEAYENYISRIPLKRFAEKNSIATAAVFLTSKKCDFITGHTLNIDGGFLAGGINFTKNDLRN